MGCHCRLYSLSDSRIQRFALDPLLLSWCRRRQYCNRLLTQWREVMIKFLPVSWLMIALFLCLAQGCIDDNWKTLFGDRLVDFVTALIISALSCLRHRWFCHLCVANIVRSFVFFSRLLLDQACAAKASISMTCWYVFAGISLHGLPHVRFQYSGVCWISNRFRTR